ATTAVVWNWAASRSPSRRAGSSCEKAPAWIWNDCAGAPAPLPGRSVNGPWTSSARSPETTTQTVPAVPTTNSGRSLFRPTRYRTPEGADGTGGATVTAGIGSGVSGVAGSAGGVLG